MSIINFTITLISDGEPASGFGTSLIDSLLPRDLERRVILPASHLKGIMRENIENITQGFIPGFVLDNLFGMEGANKGALFHIDTAVAEDAAFLNISRTRLNEFGTAEQGSLRTSEAVAAGTQFKGRILPRPGLPGEYLNLLKLGLLSIFSIGTNRNRGSGSCFVAIDSEKNSPGQILRTLAKVSDWKGIDDLKSSMPAPVVSSVRQVMLKLVFKADNPVCVPEIPIVKNNIVKSGFTISASAVQGAILHRLNDISEKAATDCYENEHFRAWPLNPVDSESSLSLRVSFTHKLSKLADSNGRFHFEDEMVRPYEWDKIPPNSPLKSSDGVFLCNGDKVNLWKSSEMARVITAHGVVNGDRRGGQKRNLYTVEALAPTTFSGLVSLPESAAEMLKESLIKNPFVTFGKSRSVRGGGQLFIQSIQFEDIAQLMRHHNIFIVQSPVLVPTEETNKPFKDIIDNLAAEYGFGDVEESSGAVTIQFGWNSTIQKGRLCAVAVIAPGSIFRVKDPLENLQQRMVAGLGRGRERGFGAVMPHPGIAKALYPDKPKPRKMKKIKNFGKEGYELWKKASARQLSASQISRVRELTALDSQKALSYLERQRTDRPETIWQRWKEVVQELENGISADANYYCKVLKVCQDLLVADKGE